MKDAVDADRAVLEIRTRDAAPADWAGDPKQTRGHPAKVGPWGRAATRRLMRSAKPWPPAAPR